jgi:hypothetical protein
LLVNHGENSTSLLFLLSLLSLLFYTLELLVEIILIRLSFYFSSLLELQPSHLSVTSIYTFLYSTNLPGPLRPESVLSKFASYFASYAKKHPILFGIQVAGGIMSLASIAAVPVLGVVGFGAAGPIAGSTAAAWQSGIGLVKAGSIYAWCQSAAMGGAAMGHILTTGVAGVSGAVGATVAGALDIIAISESELKEKFLKAWKREGGAAMGGSLATDLAGVSVAVGAIVEGVLDGIDIPAPELKEKFLKAWERDIGETQQVMTARL